MLTAYKCAFLALKKVVEFTVDSFPANELSEEIQAHASFIQDLKSSCLVVQQQSTRAAWLAWKEFQLMHILCLKQKLSEKGLSSVTPSNEEFLT